MDLSENGALYALEQLMDEFFDPSTTNFRKHEIEQQLNNFKNAPHFWNMCLYFITHSSSQYVTMFALSNLETVINQQWGRIDWNYRDELKNVLYGYLIEKGPTASHFLRSKYTKLLVDIAKQDWPERYPNFFINILELLKNDNGQLVGLVLLRTTSEEFTSCTGTFDAGRRSEVIRLLSQYIPTVFELLTGILENLGTKPRHSATATPPPSPTHPSSLPNLSHQLSAAKFRPDSKMLNKEVLLTVQHLFTWVEIQQIPSKLIEAIFNFTNVSSYAQDDDDMGVLAMSTLNELLYRKCTPPGSQDFFICLFQHTVQLLRDIVCPTSGRIETLGPDFMEKLSELMILLIEQHLWRLETEPRFSALDFLSLLYQLTLQLPAPQCYLRCLAVWAAFIKQIKPENAQKYSEAFLGVVGVVVKKMQFSYNHVQLSEMSNSYAGDEHETEWECFLKTSIEVIAMAAEYASLETFNLILVPWKEAYDIFILLEMMAMNYQNNSLKCENEETEKLCYTFRDFSSLTQTLARLSSIFTDQDNKAINKVAAPLIYDVINRLIESASLATRAKFYNLKVSASLHDSIVEVHSQVLASLKTWLLWLSQNGDISGEDLKRLHEITLPVLTEGVKVPGKISHSGAHLLLAISNLVFPTTLIVLPPIVQFIHVSPNLKYGNGQTCHVVNSAITNILLRPWGELSQEDCTHRNFLIGIFLDTLTREFRELTPTTNESRVEEVVGGTLPALSHIIEFCKNFPNSSKRLLCTGIKSSIDRALVLFPSYVCYPDVSNHILVFFLNVLGILQQQLGVEATKHAVQVFLEVAVREQQASNLSGLDKLLQILQIVVESPGSSYKSFLPGILQLCMENVYPVVMSHSNEEPDVFLALLRLLHSILLHRWQYFYMSQVRLGYSPGCSESEVGPDTPQQPEQLLAVLRVFGQALLQNDINVFRLSLFTLEDLNTKWKLYHKILFREHLLSQFVTVLLQTLVDKSHALLTDDIQVAVYNMAAVNFDAFFNTFLGHFIQTMNGLTHDQWEVLLRNFVQQHDRDVPTFVQHLQRFVSDARHFRLCNISKPEEHIR